MIKNLNKIIQNTLFIVVLLTIVVYLVFPFYWAVNSSFKTEAQLQMSPTTIVPRNIESNSFDLTFKNYINIFKNDQFVRGMLNSTIVSISTTILSLLSGSFAAFALGKLRFKGKKITLYTILAMTMFPQITVLSGLYAVINTLNIDAIPSMILSYMIFTLPFTTWVMTSFFRELPKELMQSAQVDGATPFQTFYMILLPLTAPALVTTGLLAFIQAWNEYLFALTFTSIDPAARTIPVAIALFSGEVTRQIPYGEIMAAAVVVTIPIVLLVFIFQKKIVAGLTAGAVKG
ncbi:carbohydrate ABC transporter permease [Halanaerobium salsuginis]|jgi:trehalose/maltose transport system permease protein|uniref:Maltose ABC transporter membrane protein /trehalose ABC transporter membrane protein /sucrose ABC transporter membrane protein /palatinose ABC transporter membrane protein n=1 Tax=Halanaerobium salsuginis TaxID=29563 RepID=A0A1I4FUC6_9FIRM|nr:carbohydrate ABC transporter permease [Halanaerobium salsuginis]SFL21502.1 maltose ABC transporter membrane protein /trehalose ABC transporter membrane protein /sucrose ABC transporter membrane protein /palatinose ABC transporter membrane protein [Halanaerobium salsuginis]